MKKAAASVVILLALIAAGYLLFTHRSVSEGSVATTTPAIAQSFTVATSTLAEEGTDYSVHVDYPQFGNASIDAQIRDAVTEAAAELKAQAATDTPTAQGFPKYEFIGQYSSVYIGPDVISFREMLAQDTGGAHPLPTIYGFNFDANTGKMLTLNDALAKIGLSLANVAASAKTQLNTQLGTDIIFPEGADPKSENYQTFLIQKNNVIFIFQPYQVAPYSAGTPQVSFPRK